MYKITKEIKKDNNELLRISIAGKVDSNNAALVEKELMDIVHENANLPIVINAKELEYISSAGLRVILKLVKIDPELEIINVCNDVYEIFEMTGFTEMVTIKKAYREFSVDGCTIIGEGAKGIVYRYNDDTIIKVYKKDDCLPQIQRERELAKKAFILGIPTAISYDCVMVGDNYGSVFELLDCKSLSQLIQADPDNIEKYAKGFADLLKQIHSTRVRSSDFSNGKSILTEWIDFSRNYLDEEITNKLSNMVRDLPERLTLIHGDYHTNNVMVQNGELLLIDMDTLCYGHPIIELGIVDFTYNTYNDIKRGNVEEFLGISHDQAKAVYKIFLKEYFETDDEDELKKYTDKIDLISYLRVIKHVSRRDCDKVKIDKAVSEIKRLIDGIDTLDF